MQTFIVPKIQKKKSIAAAFAVFSMFFVGAWVTFDISEVAIFDTIGQRSSGDWLWWVWC